MDLVIPVNQTAGYRPVYTPQPSVYPQVVTTMMPNATPQTMYSPSMYPQPSIMPQMISPYQHQSMNNYSLTPIIPNDNRALHNLSNRLNDTRDINEYSNKGLSEDNMRIIGNMIDKRVNQAIKESPEYSRKLKEDIETVNSNNSNEVNEVNEIKESETKEEIDEKEESETETESDSETEEIEEKPKKKKTRRRKVVTKKKSKHRKRIRRKRRTKKGKPRKMKVKKSLLRNNIIVDKTDDELNKLKEFFFEKEINIEDIPKKIKSKIIPSLEIQKHSYYLESLKDSERKLINKFMNDKEFNHEVHNYVRKELNNNPEMDKQISNINSIIKNAPKLTRNIVVFKDINVETKLKKNNIYTESSIGVSRFNPLPISKGDTNTLSIKIPKLNKCLILAKNNIFDTGEILMPLSSKFKINNIKNISLNNNEKHILYQSSLQS